MTRGADLKKFFSSCIDSGSLPAIHEVLYRIAANSFNGWQSELKAIARIDVPPSVGIFAISSWTLRLNKCASCLVLRIGEVEPGCQVPAGSFVFGIKVIGELSFRQCEIWTDQFVIDKFPVTNLEYKAFVDSTGGHPPRHWRDGVIPYGQEYAPVIYVSWFDAASYAVWKGKRLPTEAEWERAGYWDERAKKKRLYPWGEEFDMLRANYFDANIGRPSVIGHFSPQGDSAYGVTDMAGNVYEWVLDDAIEPFGGLKETVIRSISRSLDSSSRWRGAAPMADQPSNSSAVIDSTQEPRSRATHTSDSDAWPRPLSILESI